MDVSVAVRAMRKGQLFIEIPIDMARGATHAEMSALQRVLRFGVIEYEPAEKPFPTRCSVAILAALRPE